MKDVKQKAVKNKIREGYKQMKEPNEYSLPSPHFNKMLKLRKPRKLTGTDVYKKIF